MLYFCYRITLPLIICVFVGKLFFDTFTFYENKKHENHNEAVNITNIVQEYGRFDSKEKGSITESDMKARTTFLGYVVNIRLWDKAIGVVGLIPADKKQCPDMPFLVECSPFSTSMQQAIKDIGKAHQQVVVGSRIIGFSKDEKYTYVAVSVKATPYSDDAQKAVDAIMRQATSAMLHAYDNGGVIFLPATQVKPLTEYPIIIETPNVATALRISIHGDYKGVGNGVEGDMASFMDAKALKLTPDHP